MIGKRTHSEIADIRRRPTLLLAAMMICGAQSAVAQITFNNTIGRQPLCTNEGEVFTSGDNDCTSDEGEFLNIDTIIIGPEGGLLVGSGTSQTILDAGSGNVTVGGELGVTGVTTFRGDVELNAAFGADLRAGSGTRTTTLANNGDVTVGGNLTVAAGRSVNMGGNRIQFVATPTDATDAANKAYVDAQGAGAQTQIDAVVAVNTAQNGRLTAVETVNTAQNTRLTGVETVNAVQDTRLASAEATLIEQGQSIASINRSIGRLQDRDEELAGGIAIAVALAQPMMQPGQSFAMRAGWGSFDGTDALGVTAAGVLSRDVFGPGSTVVLDAGIGVSTDENEAAGRFGVTFGW